MTTDTTETVVEAATSTSVAVVTPKITQTCVAGQRATRRHKSVSCHLICEGQRDAARIHRISVAAPVAGELAPVAHCTALVSWSR
jgi:hypothetical protein